MIVPAIGFELPATPAVRHLLATQGITPEGFGPWIQQIDRETKRREQNGERDHMIHYALLSRTFTVLPPIEPALSAKEFTERGVVPESAMRRLKAFQTALRNPGGSERLNELRPIAAKADFFVEYRRAMRFLYSKEFEKNASYAERGHSTDTSLVANYAVWNGLSVLKQMRPQLEIKRVLIVGPGLDFAPRTSLQEEARPQSYQPFAVLDALPGSTVHCYDINRRVIRFLAGFHSHPVLEIPTGDGGTGFRSYLASMGQQIGRVTRSSGSIRIEVTPEYAGRISAEEHNLLTEAPKGLYDLVIATNVLVYYTGPELTLAVANISAHMKPGSYFLHNDLRPELDRATEAAGLTALAARTVQITPTTFDAFALYGR